MDTEVKSSSKAEAKPAAETLRTLPSDNARCIMWRFADRYDLQMLVQSSRAVARGPIARMVADGLRNEHEWTERKSEMLKHFDDSGITAAFLEAEYGGFIDGPKNTAVGLIAFELSWVDAGAATCSLAGNLALEPIHERGTPEQRAEYMTRMAPNQPDGKPPLRGSFALTEPLPYVGVDTGVLAGRMRIVEWEEGKEPILHVEKRGRFITNMGFADFVTAAVESDDPRIKGTCMVILEKSDPGIFDRGTATKKLVHQLSSTCDPVLSLKVPAHRIVGGYDIKDGVIVPRYNHGEVIEAVFRRTRVTVALMTPAKLLSAVEPIIRYQRGRFRGGSSGTPGTVRYEYGLQAKEDALHRLVDVWATGEAAASLGFAAARLFDELEPLEKCKTEILGQQGVRGGRAEFKAMRRVEADTLELLNMNAKAEADRDQARYQELMSNDLVQFMQRDTVANVLCPASKLWNTGYGATAMREAVSLMGGYGITEDCPGFLPQKWMDAQLEATYEGPEVVQRRQLSVTMSNAVFLAQFKNWIADLRRIAAERPGTGACSLAMAMQMWLWTLNHLHDARDANGSPLYHGPRQGVTFPLADVLCWLLGARQLVLDVIELEEKGPADQTLSEGLEGLVNFYRDLCHVQCARAAGEVGRVCAELVHGYNRHPAWDEQSCGACYDEKDLEELEGMMPGNLSTAPSFGCVGDNGAHSSKAGPCVKFDGIEQFVRLRLKLDGCLTGSRLAKDRAAGALTKVMIPEALDYPV